MYHRPVPRDPVNKHSLMQLTSSLATVKEKIKVVCL